jgi:polyisoprenoid-binding protein YceI
LIIEVDTAKAQNQVIRSSVSFKIKNLGISNDGSFKGLRANIHFNPANLGSSTIEATVDAATIDTDNADRDEHLKNEDFFDVLHYPKITLKSVSFKSKGGNKYVGSFNLTIKSTTKSVDVPFTYTDNGASANFTGTFKIDRTDFGIGSNSMILSDDATIAINADIGK